MWRLPLTVWLIPALLLATACDCGDRSLPSTNDETRLQRRVLQPPPVRARAVPPHNIRARGIGPYELEMGLTQVLALLPHGPRVEVLAVNDLFHYNLVRTESDALIIGAAPQGSVSFVAAVNADIARLETGVGVGASVAELDEVLGELEHAAEVARDPRVRVYQALPTARFLVIAGRVRAVLVGPPSDVEGRPAPPSGGAAPGGDAGVADSLPCAGVDLLEAPAEELLAAAGAGDGAAVVHGCFEGATLAIVWGDDRAVLVGADGGKLRRLGAVEVPGLLYAAAIDADGDGGHDLVTVSRQMVPASHIVRVDAYRVEGGRPVAVAGADIFQLSANSAAWVGARPSDVDFLVELRASSGVLQVGGLYLQRAGTAIRNLVPVEPRSLPVRRRRPAAGGAGETGAGDAGPAAGGLRAPLLPPPPQAGSDAGPPQAAPED